MLQILLALCALVGTAPAHAGNYVTQGPLVAQSRVADCKVGQPWNMPVIAWGADIATSYANGNSKRTARGSIIDQHGLDLQLVSRDDFRAQLDDYLTCRSPFLRGTLGMINTASELTNRDPRTQMVVFHQLSWSTGADALVVRGDINELTDLKGKTIVLQAYGPHVDLLVNVLQTAGLSASDVTIKYVPDLLVTDKNSFSPATAMSSDPSVAAAFVIMPEAQVLTAHGTVGTGREGSVKGARILFSTAQAGRVVPDVYAVRKDFFDANRDRIEALAHALLVADEKTVAIMGPNNTDKKSYSDLVSAAAGLLLDNPTDSDDIVQLYQGMRLAGYGGNFRFFTDSNYPSGFDGLTAEIQPAFMQMRLLTRRVSLTQAGWDWTRMARDLTNTGDVVVPHFNPAAAARFLEGRVQRDTEQGELFGFNILFSPRQSDFPVALYQAQFENIIKRAVENAGDLIDIQGYVDPSGYLTSLGLVDPEKPRLSPDTLTKQRQGLKNLSLRRANAVRDAVIAYAKTKGITFDPGQFNVTGWGVDAPGCVHDSSGEITLACKPQTDQEWVQSRRVRFSFTSVDTESDVFVK